MEMAPNQMGELDKERVNEGVGSVPQNDCLLLRERQVYSLREAVGKKNQAASEGAISRCKKRIAVSLTIEDSYLQERSRIMSSSRDQRAPV